MLVYDSYSDDGSWQYIREMAAGDPRIHAWQGPREGIYPAWNRCVERAAGEFVYVATSDDTMADDCLAKLTAALTAEPNCGLAHCSVRFCDRDGHPVDDWWSADAPFRQSSPDLVDVPHVRMAPLDGLLHLTGQSVYFSVTQLLIRRTTLARVGPFDPGWGSFGDFHWNMRAGLTCDTVHVPDTWGGWRMHADQATALADTCSDAYWDRIDALMRDAIGRAGDELDHAVRTALPGRWAGYHRQYRRLHARLQATPSRLGRVRMVCGQAAAGGGAGAGSVTMVRPRRAGWTTSELPRPSATGRPPGPAGRWFGRRRRR